MDIETFLDQLDNDTLPEIVKNNEVSETLWLRLKDHFSNEYARMELQEIICDDLTDMHLMVGTSRKRMRSITKCSHGQRNTAVLDILLSLPELGLIIDQPEDELDNAYLYNHLITSLRKIKNKRQIIAPTHNPNIPVSGDAENVICLQNNDEILEITHQGSIDNIGIIEQVQNNMEGGKEAFERRIWKYGYRIADIQ
jgi:energy-coupling factor transporter ATP-binding protein EcfA2